MQCELKYNKELGVYQERYGVLSGQNLILTLKVQPQRHSVSSQSVFSQNRREYTISWNLTKPVFCVDCIQPVTPGKFSNLQNALRYFLFDHIYSETYSQQCEQQKLMKYNQCCVHIFSLTACLCWSFTYLGPLKIQIANTTNFSYKSVSTKYPK